MTVKVLLNVLHQWRPRLLTGDGQSNVSDYERLTEDVCFQPGILYVGTCMEMEKLNAGKQYEGAILLLIHEDAGRWDKEINCRQHRVVIELMEATSIAAVLQLLSELFEDNANCASLAKNLIGLPNRFKTVKEMLNEAAKIFEANLICVSSGGRTIYGYTKYLRFFEFHDFDHNPIQNFGDYDEQHGEFSIESHAASLIYNYAKEYTDSRPFALWNEKTGKWQIRCRLYYKNTYLGNFGTSWETYEAIAKINRGLFQTFADVLAAQIANQLNWDRHDMNPVDNRNLLLGDILDGAYVTEEMEKAICDSGLDYPQMCLLYIPIYSYGKIKKANGNLKEKLSYALPHSYIFYYRRNVVVLLNRELDEHILQLKQWQNMMRDNALLCIVSDVFLSFHEMKKRYEQLSRIYKLIVRLECGLEESRIFYYRDFKLLDLCDCYCRVYKYEYDILLDFCVPELQEIKRYDLAKGTNFFETLESYVRSERSLMATAEQLNLHKSTVAYRLQRMKKMFGIDLENGQALFQYYQSFEMYKLVNMPNPVEEV